MGVLPDLLPGAPNPRVSPTLSKYSSTSDIVGVERRVTHRHLDCGVAELAHQQVQRHSGSGEVYSRSVPVVVDSVAVDARQLAGAGVLLLRSTSGHGEQPVGARYLPLRDIRSEGVGHPRWQEHVSDAGLGLGVSDLSTSLRSAHS